MLNNFAQTIYECRLIVRYEAQIGPLVGGVEKNENFYVTCRDSRYGGKVDAAGLKFAWETDLHSYSSERSNRIIGLYILTKPVLITFVRESSASQGVGWNRTDFEFFKYAPPMLPISCFGINCIINFCGHESAFLKQTYVCER